VSSTTATTTQSNPTDLTNPEGATTTATLTLTGNNPATWPQNFPFKDNLGALFNHPTQAGNPVSETIYSTSTVDTTKAGTTTIDYWATDPSTGDVLHAIRGIVITAPAAAANDNAPVTTPVAQSTSSTTAANDNQPIIPLAATGTKGF
jgi:hypothetical protein